MDRHGLVVVILVMGLLLAGCTNFGPIPSVSIGPTGSPTASPEPTTPTPTVNPTATACSNLGGQCVPYRIPECAPPVDGEINPSCFFHCPNGGHVDTSGICGLSPLNGRMVCCVLGPTPTASPSVVPTASPTASSTPSVSATPTPAAGSLAELRYDVLAAVGGTIEFCDRDYYPIGSPGREQQNADAYVANPPDQQEFQIILNHLGLSGTAAFSESQKLQIYREYKRIRAIYFSAQASGYDFTYLVRDPSSNFNPSPNVGTFDVKGSVTFSGSVTISSLAPGQLMCPICLSASTPIDTPNGPVAVEKLQPGMTVFTLSATGEKMAASIVQTAFRPAEAGQPIVHLVLADGRSVWLSAGHPLSDGRLVADLKEGDSVDGSTVASVDVGAYEGAATFDLLPAGATGTYWADGILVGSTLKR